MDATQLCLIAHMNSQLRKLINHLALNIVKRHVRQGKLSLPTLEKNRFITKPVSKRRTFDASYRTTELKNV